MKLTKLVEMLAYSIPTARALAFWTEVRWRPWEPPRPPPTQPPGATITYAYDGKRKESIYVSNLLHGRESEPAQLMLKGHVQGAFVMYAYLTLLTICPVHKVYTQINI